MMISKEQALAAANQLKTGPAPAAQQSGAEVCPETLAAAMAAIDDIPDVNAFRVAVAKYNLKCADTDSRDVASMMIQRIISDSLR